MTPLPLILSAASLTAVLTAWISYLASIPKEKVARQPVGTLVMHAAGILLAGAALFLGMKSGLSGAVIGLSATSAGLAVFFVYLLSQSPLPAGHLTVGVGDALPTFRALASDGSPFNSESFAGKRILFKFFRGSW